MRHSYTCHTYLPLTPKHDSIVKKTYNQETPDTATNLLSFCVLSTANILPIKNVEYMFCLLKTVFPDKIFFLTFPWQKANCLTFPDSPQRNCQPLDERLQNIQICAELDIK